MSSVYPVLTIRRSWLVELGACAQWIALFDEVCALRGEDRAPIVRRGKKTFRDPSRLRIELTPLAQAWLSMPLARDMVGSAWAWLRETGVVGPANLRCADLRGADLRGADLRGADLRGAVLSCADLRGAYLSGADLRGAVLSCADLRGAYLSCADLSCAKLSGAKLSGAKLSGADLRGADLTGADLTGADRRAEDAAIPGWYVRDGRLTRGGAR